MSNPSGIPDGAAPIQQLNWSTGASGSFAELLMNLIINNTTSATVQVNCYLAVDGAECGTWPIQVTPGFSNTLLALRLPSVAAGAHYFINYLYASVAGVNIVNSEMGVKVLKA